MERSEIRDLPASLHSGYVLTDHLYRPVEMRDTAKTVVWQATWLPFAAASSITGTASLDARLAGLHRHDGSLVHS